MMEAHGTYRPAWGATQITVSPHRGAIGSLMVRFYCPDLGIPVSADPACAPASDHLVDLDPDQTHHARRVLRLGPGSRVELFDGQGHEAPGTIDSFGPRARVRVERIASLARPSPRLDIAVAIPKGPRAQSMARTLSELGVDCIVPLRTDRSVVAPGQSLLNRFGRIAIESAKQCGRAYLMDVAKPAGVREILDADHDVRLITTPEADPARDPLAQVSRARRILVLVGPEGGWTDRELRGADDRGCVRWKLGSNILRIETAAAAAAAIVRARCGPGTTPHD